MTDAKLYEAVLFKLYYFCSTKDTANSMAFLVRVYCFSSLFNLFLILFPVEIFLK